MTLHRLTPDAQQIDSASALYTRVADRTAGTRVDCASCTRRHERDALLWFQLPGGNREWLLAAICDTCTTLSVELIERAIVTQQPPTREATGWRDGQRMQTIFVCDPDFAMDRAS